MDFGRATTWLSRTGSSAGPADCAASRPYLYASRHSNIWPGSMPCTCATLSTVTPDCSDSSTTRNFASFIRFRTGAPFQRLIAAPFSLPFRLRCPDVKLRTLTPELHLLYRKVDLLTDEDQKALLVVLDSLVKPSSTDKVMAE